MRPGWAGYILLINGLTFPSHRILLLKHHGLLAFQLELSRGCETCWASPDNAHRVTTGVLEFQDAQGEGEFLEETLHC